MPRSTRSLLLVGLLAFLAMIGCETADSMGFNDGENSELEERVATTGPTSNNLIPKGQLTLGQYLQSDGGAYKLTLQSDGNLVLKRVSDSSVRWTSGTNGKSVTRFVFQNDGNLILLTASGTAVWRSSTTNSGATNLVLNKNGSLVLYKSSTVVWSVNGTAPADQCPNDPNKTEPGLCGCGVPEGTCNGNPDNPLAANKTRGEWSLVIIPDTQGYAENWTPNYPYSDMQTAFQWLASNAATMNIKLVQSVGDMVEANNNTEWNRVKESYGYLSRSNVEFSPCQGNHDSASYLNNTFPASQFQEKSGWGGSYGGMQNSYRSMQIGAEKYLFITVQWNPNQQVLDWVKGILRDNPSKKAIIASHFIYSPKNGSSSSLYSQIVSRYPQVALTNSGHLCTREEYSTSNNGKTHNFLTDYQCDTPGIFNIRIYKFKPLEDKVLYYTYSPIKKRFEIDASSQGSFSLVQN